MRRRFGARWWLIRRQERKLSKMALGFLLRTEGTGELLWSGDFGDLGKYSNVDLNTLGANIREDRQRKVAESGLKFW